jgi:hypothetical protein
MNELLKDLKENNEKFSEEYYEMMQNYYEKLMKTENAKSLDPNEPDAEGGITITPTQGFCLKTKDTNGQKIFLNITSHEKVESPKEEHILEVDNKYGVRLPLSLSDRYEDFDTNNQICQVYDVIFNPNIVKKAEDDPMVLEFVMQVLSERVKQKYNQELSQEFVKLKKLKYKGKAIRSQRIRYRKGPKIEEVIKPELDTVKEHGINLNSKEISKEVNQKGKTPTWNLIILKDGIMNLKNFKIILEMGIKLLASKFTINEFNHNKSLNKQFKESLKSNSNESSNDFFLYYDGSNATPEYGKCLIYIIEMNLISKSVGINLNISDESLILNCPKLYSLELNFPFKINSSEAYSIFTLNDRLLYVILPFHEKDIIDMQGFSKEKLSVQDIKISDDYLFDLIE